MASDGQGIDVETDQRIAPRLTTTDENGRIVNARSPRLRTGHATTTIDNLDPGTYTVTITSDGGELTPITATVLVWPPDPDDRLPV